MIAPQPLVVMTTVPVALGGALGLLALAGPTLRPLLPRPHLLAGIVVTTPSWLSTGSRTTFARLSVDEAVRQAGAERYRPILMTPWRRGRHAPLALLGGEGVELRRSPGARGDRGMSLSTFSSLLLVLSSTGGPAARVTMR